MPRYGFTIVPLDPYAKPSLDILRAVEEKCQADFAPNDTYFSLSDSPQLIFSGENETCMTCPICGEIDREFRWLDTIQKQYSGRRESGGSFNFSCHTHCCNKPANLLDYDFRYDDDPIELGAAFACAEVSAYEVEKRLTAKDVADFAELMACPIRVVLASS